MNQAAMALFQKLSREGNFADPERLNDRELLERFASQRDEQAFAILVRRHGPMVQSVCRRILPGSADVDDAFQATFTILARKAGQPGWNESVANWLYGVALRVALKLRQSGKIRREALAAWSERAVSPVVRSGVTLRELGHVLDEEIQGMPSDYRTPIVLCYLGGQTQDQAARQLGLPRRTFQRRLEWAREWLQKRLIRRGYAVPAALAGVLSFDGMAPAAVPRALIKSTCQLAVGSAATAGSWPTSLACSVASAIGHFTRLPVGRRVGIVFLLLLGVAGTSLGVVLSSGRSERDGGRLGVASVRADLPNERFPLPAPARNPSGPITWRYNAAANTLVINGPAGGSNFMVMGGNSLQIVDHHCLDSSSRLLQTGIRLGPSLKLEIHGSDGINYIVNGLGQGQYQAATIWGGTGPDLIVAGGGRDTLYGGPGGGMLASYGNSQAILHGGNGKTVFVVCPGSKAYSGKGESTFYFGSTDVTMIGGPSVNHFIYNGADPHFNRAQFRGMKTSFVNGVDRFKIDRSAR
jgi:RNA polymerase sigma factor (sigma-70 family)